MCLCNYHVLYEQQELKQNFRNNNEVQQKARKMILLHNDDVFQEILASF